MWPFKCRVSDLTNTLSRDELKRKGRILIIDDEEPAIRGDLEQNGFSTQYAPDIDATLQANIESLRFDLILLDFSGVGSRLGKEEGLAVLRHLKRVVPSVVILAYTSKALTSSQADFYRMTDGVLNKDAGIGETLEKIEEGLAKALSVNNLWNSFLTTLGVTSGSSEDVTLQHKFVKMTRKPRNKESFTDLAISALKSEESRQMAIAVLNKLLTVAIGAPS